MKSATFGKACLVGDESELGSICLVGHIDKMGKNCLETKDQSRSLSIGSGLSLGGKRGVLALFITSADVSRGCWQASVLWRFLRNESSQGIADYLSSPESKFVTYPFWRQVTSRFVEHLTNSSAVLHAVVQPSFSTAYYAYSVFLAVCQVLRDISCVNPSRTPKAFKGKGSAVNQGVNSSLLVLAGAGA